jgi:TRAP-type C4-dicarboxylate transport system substrate-binding protein
MKGPPGNRITRTVRNVQRLWPVVMMAWERWQRLTPEQQERYKRQASEYLQRGKDAAARKRQGR